MDLSRRVIRFPVEINLPRAARRVYRVARALGERDVDKATAALETAIGPAAFAGRRREQRFPEEAGSATLTDAHDANGDASPSADETVEPVLRALLLGRILIDLYEAGWEVEVERTRIYVIAPKYDGQGGVTPAEAKARVSQLLAPRVAAKLSKPTVRQFIRDMEGGGDGSAPGVRALIADGAALARSLRTFGPEAVKPYVQRARPEDGVEPLTGKRLWDIFRYMRFHWSFPYENTPGRTLPFLIRDAGQPNHPVCGLLCLTSPVLRLTARDSALGWTAAWAEAVVAGLDVSPRGEMGKHELRRHFTALRDQLASRRSVGGSPIVPALLMRDLCAYLRLSPSGDPAEVAKRTARLGEELRPALDCARRRLTGAIIDEMRGTVERVDTRDLGVETAAALLDPLETARRLEVVGVRARGAWAASRGEFRERGGAGEADWLFVKKRAIHLARALKAWNALGDLRIASPQGEQELARALRAATGSRRCSWTERPWGLTVGREFSRGVRAALLQRLTRLMSSQVADVSVCGAIAPYNDLLGGKLAGLLALSREVAAAWHEAYSGLVSDIQSRMEGRKVVRPAELLALSTTSFYPVGSAQYNRLRLGDDLRWVPVGSSAGHGTLHFSDTTTAVAQRLLVAETGRRLITSRFGEGASEKMRKLREAMSRLRLPANELLRHGMSRIVYVAELDEGTRPGTTPVRGGHHLRGPTAETICDFWRRRWLARRVRDESRLDRLEPLRPERQLISLKYHAVFSAEDTGTEGCDDP